MRNQVFSEEQSAMAKGRRRAEPGLSQAAVGEAGPRHLRSREGVDSWRRLRSSVALLVLTAIIGALVAAALGVLIVVVALALQNAAG